MVLPALMNFIQFYRDFVSRVQSCCQSIYNQRFTLLAILFLCIICKYVPFVLSFLISCSPILICTAVLLHTLLSFGQPNVEEEEKKKPHETPLSVRRLEKRNNISLESGLRKRNEIRERALEKSGIPLGNKPSTSREKKVAFSPMPAMEMPRPKEKSPEKEIEEVDDAETSSFGSDRAECSSPDTPLMNALPVIDEKNPLLETKPPQLPVTSGEDSDAVLESSDRSVDGSVDSEAENQEGSQGNEVGGGGTKPLVLWTEDDEKNLMDLGTSELERNQRLESLIAKRRARKSVVEKNLIDFDTTYNPPVPAIKPLKSNPFDLPFTASEIDGIPGSAPSVLVPRGNPFDLPYDPQEEKPNLTQDSFQQEFTSVFCRHGSFSFGAGPSYMDKYNSKFTPFFGGEGTTSERNAQSGNSVFDSLPPIDRRNRKKQMDRVLSLGVYPTSHYQQERRMPEVSFFKPYQDLKRDYEFNKFETKETGQDLSLQNKNEEAFMEPEVIKEEVSDVKNEESLSESTPQVLAEDSKEESESDLNSNSSAMEGVDDAHTKEPVYDSSPSAVEKRTIDEYLLYSDKTKVLTSSSSIASDLQVEVSEAGSPRESLDRYSYTDGESSFQDGIDKSSIEARDSSIDEKELRPIEENENGEYVYNSFLPPVPEATEEDHIDDTPLSSPRPNTHVEVHEPDLVAVDSMVPSPSAESDKEEMVQEEQPSNGHSEEHQEETLHAIEEAEVRNVSIENIEEIKEGENSISNENMDVSPPITDVNVEESNGTHENTEGPVSPSKPMEATRDNVEENNQSHETAEAVASPMEDTRDNVVEDNVVHEPTEVTTDTEKPIEVTQENVEESNGEITQENVEESNGEVIVEATLPENVEESNGEVLTDTSQPIEATPENVEVLTSPLQTMEAATMNEEARIVHEGMDSNTEKQVFHVEEEALKLPHEDSETLQMESKIEKNVGTS